MTPTLFGRWQTRLLLFATAGVLGTLPFAIVYGNSVFFTLLIYVALMGLGWDIFYNYLQTFRWDHDWPTVFQLLAGIGEAIAIALLMSTVGLPGVPVGLPLELFALHYSLVWLLVFCASQILMRIVFPRWRFRGGQWW
jgi:hypothetical protein